MNESAREKMTLADLRRASDAAIRALQLIAVTWARRPDAETIAELKAAVRGSTRERRLVENAERALTKLERIEARLVEQGCLDPSACWLAHKESITLTPAFFPLTTNC